jgi:hypothetical protein
MVSIVGMYFPELKGGILIFHIVRCGLEPPEVFDYLGMKL